MHSSLRLTLGALALSASFISCKQQAATAGQTVALETCEKPDTVIATYGDGKKVTLKEVDALVGQQLKQMEKEKTKLRKQAVEQVVVEAWATEQGAAAGKSKDEFLQGELEKLAQKPTDAEVEAFYNENQARMPPGSTLESIKPQIQMALSREKKQQAIGKLIEDVRQKMGVQVLIADARTQVEATGPSKGPADAKVTIVEFSDFECPYCSRAEATVDQVLTAHAGKVRIVYRHFPLSQHPNAGKAAEASLCAHEQGKFWEYKKVLFENQDKLGQEALKQHAKDVGLEQASFDKCLESGSMKAKVDADMKAATDAAIGGTPSFFVNGIQVDPSFEEFDRVIKQELASAK